MKTKNNSKPKILFVCRGNTCRSFMAEAIARQLSGDRIEVFSRGIAVSRSLPTEGALNTLLKHFGIDGSCHTPRQLTQADMETADLVVAMNTDIAESEELSYVSQDRILVWKIEDPWAGNDEMYRNCAVLITGEIQNLLNSLEGTPKRTLH
jgi:protein-tyrosine-phosphatase